MERTTMATIGAQLGACFCLNVTGSSCFFFLSFRETPELHLCFKCLRTGSYPLAGLFCVGSSLIITLNMLLHTFLLPLVYCTNCVASEAFSIEAAQLIYRAFG